MNPNPQTTDPRQKETTRGGYDTAADQTPRREGGDDALSETNPRDSRMDEKVIVNEQSENKIVNGSSQTDAHAGGNDNTVDEIQ